jgi:non-homologous end joining protein Ku
MSKYYVQLDENDIVHTVSQNSEVIELENCIEIQELDYTLLSKKYNFITEEFEEV